MVLADTVGMLSNDGLVVGVRADPKPQHAAFGLHGKSAIAAPDPNRVEASDLLQLQRRMPWILFQQSIVLVGERPDIFGKSGLRLPKCRAREVPHNSRARPAR
jgi:hypothetical protein